MHFRMTLNSTPWSTLEAGREAVGDRGVPPPRICLARYAPTLKHEEADLPTYLPTYLPSYLPTYLPNSSTISKRQNAISQRLGNVSQRLGNVSQRVVNT